MTPNRQIFEQLKANRSVPAFTTTKEAYFYVKAHKLAAQAHFHQYWNSRDKQPLKDILNDHYPPLEYCHDQSKGYPGLDAYVNMAKGVFNDSQTTNSSN